MKLDEGSLADARISGVGRYLPRNVRRGADVEELIRNNSDGFEVSGRLVELLSGVVERRYVSEQESNSSDLAALAAIDALRNSGHKVSDVDVLIFASASQDMSEPATANVVQERIGCAGAYLFDLKNACNSVLNALDVAAALIQTNRADTVLVTSGEVLSKFVDWRISGPDDLQTKFAALTLGDAGGSFVISRRAPSDAGRLFPASFLSDGSQWRLSTVLAGGTLVGVNPDDAFFRCESDQLQSLALEHIPNLVKKALAEIGWDVCDVDLVIPHQVSNGIVRSICMATGVPYERCYLSLNLYGNTAAASIPLAASLAEEAGRLRKGDRVLFIAGAAGFSAGVIPLVW